MVEQGKRQHCCCFLYFLAMTVTTTILARTDDGNIYRLFGGASPNEGVLQVRSRANESAWYSLCSSAIILEPGLGASPCKQQGYRISCSVQKVASLQSFRAPPGFAGFPVKRVYTSCGGVDWTCSLMVDRTGEQTCDQEEVLWIMCGSDLEFRLGPGPNENEGPLQVRCNNTDHWHGICGGDHWLAASWAHRVACHHLGYPGTVYTIAYNYEGFFGAFLDELSCLDGKDSLIDCQYRQPLQYPCFGFAGLRCNHQDVELKLVDSQYEASGFVVGRSSSTDGWGVICRGSWDDRDAQVTCRHLGYLGNINVRRAKLHDASKVPNSTFVSRVGCQGNERSLSQCELVFDALTSCSEFAYVECKAATARFDFPAYLCGEIHYCGFDCNKGRHDTLRPWPQETCKCDDVCVFFGDCCYDYSLNCDPAPDWRTLTMGGISVQYYACVALLTDLPVTENFGFALVSFCPEQWKDVFVKQLCEGKVDDDDAIGSLPVFDVKGAVYRNIFCAACHRVHLRSVQKWGASLEYISGNPTHNSRFNVTIDGDLTGRFVFKPPKRNTSLGSARTCPVNFAHSCDQEFQNTSVEESCSDYFAPFHVNEKAFKNPHCAVCTNVSLTSPVADCGLLCSPICSDVDKWAFCSEVCGAPSALPRLEILFDFGWGPDENSGCKPGQFFDPFLERCRTLICASGATDEDGQCSLESQPHVKLPSKFFSLLSDECNEIINRSLGPEVVHCQALPAGYIDSTDVVWSNFTLSILLQTPHSVGSGTEGDYRPVLGNQFLEETDIKMCNITSLLVYVLDGAGLLKAVDACTNFTHKSREIFLSFRGANSSQDILVFFLTAFTRQNYNTTRSAAISIGCLDMLELHCSQVALLEENEYTYKDDLLSIDLEHIPKGRRFGPREFTVLPDGKAAVCGPIDGSDPNDSLLGILTLVCSCLSLVGLAATFVTYCTFQKLRNTAGIYTMNLLVALFTALLLFVLESPLGLDGGYCVVLASLVHFSWISAFLWMATLSVNAAKTFGGRNLRPRALGRHHSCYRLLTIMTVVWGSALVIVAVCLVLNFCNCTHLPVIYSKTSPCAFTGPGVRLLAFGVPVAASLLVSTGSFLFVILSVRKSKKDSKMVRARESMNELQDQVKIYGKLAILFGITWILSFTVGVVGHVALKYIDATVNPLQGVFIFAAFCLNQRVRGMWRGWLGKRTQQECRQTPVPKGSTTNLSTISSSTGNTKL